MLTLLVLRVMKKIPFIITLFVVIAFFSISGCTQQKTDPDMNVSLDYNITGSSSNELQNFGDVISCTVVEKNTGNANLINCDPFIHIGIEQSYYNIKLSDPEGGKYFKIDDDSSSFEYGLEPGESLTYTYNCTFTEDDVPKCDMANRTLRVYAQVHPSILYDNNTQTDLGDRNTTIFISINKSANLTIQNPFLDLKDYLPNYPGGAVVHIQNDLDLDICVAWVMNGTSEPVFRVVIPAYGSRTVSAPSGNFDEYIIFNYSKNGHLADVPLGDHSISNPYNYGNGQLESGNEYNIRYDIKTEKWVNGVPQLDPSDVINNF